MELNKYNAWPLFLMRNCYDCQWYRTNKNQCDCTWEAVEGIQWKICDGCGWKIGQEKAERAIKKTTSKGSVSIFHYSWCPTSQIEYPWYLEIMEDYI